MILQQSSRIIVTGALGLIGGAVVRELNRRGYKNLVLVDNLRDGDKWKMLNGISYSEYVESKDLFDWFRRPVGAVYSRLEDMAGMIDTIIHCGAESSTTEKDSAYLYENNYGFTKSLVNYPFYLSQSPGKFLTPRILYMSSAATYGDGTNGYKDREDVESLESLRPLNAYANSKHMLDLYLARHGGWNNCVGIKPFNIFGWRESHKIGMESMVLRAYRQIKGNGSVNLFKSYNPNYADGEQRRDFLYVKDAAKAIVSMTVDSNKTGLFNLGSGTSTTWNELVGYVFEAMDKPVDIKYIDMPEEMRGKYQYSTKANINKLKFAIPDFSPTPIKEAVKDYVVNYLGKGL